MQMRALQIGRKTVKVSFSGEKWCVLPACAVLGNTFATGQIMVGVKEERIQKTQNNLQNNKVPLSRTQRPLYDQLCNGAPRFRIFRGRMAGKRGEEKDGTKLINPPPIRSAILVQIKCF